MSTEARFAPGDWYAVVGDGVTVLLPVSQRGRVATLWDLADSGAAADALLPAYDAVVRRAARTDVGMNRWIA